MRNLLLGLVVGTGLGYVFHDDIDQALRQTAKRANEKLNDEGTGQEPIPGL